MLQPTGPLPSEIYWRRRMLAVGVLVVTLIALMWTVLSLRGGDSPQAAPAAASSSQAATQSAAATATTDTSGSASSRTTAGSTATGSSSTAPSSTAPSSTAAAPVAQPAPVPPGQCPDQSLAVKVTVEQPTYAVGVQPKFGVTITNISSSPCTRDVGSGQTQVLVYSGNGQQRLWSSTDCFPDPAVMRHFNPGQQAGFSIEWSAKTSQPACAGSREAVKPGEYTVVAQLGGLRSAPEPFSIA